MLAGDIRRGTTFDMEGAIYTVVEFQQVKQARSASFIRTKIKNVETGNIVERKFNPTDKLDEAKIEKTEMQYLYSDGELYYFMNSETYEQFPVDYATAEDALKFIKEEGLVTVYTYKDKIIQIEPPIFAELVITECEPGLQGDSSRAGTKPAKLETGYDIRVPLFVNNGEKIRVDTRTGEYVERV
ncbi:MAG: elongation factor P [Spirochaetales bacterium]